MSVLEKASDLIDCLGQAGEPVTLAHVRSALAMPKSSTHRLLSELAALGIVRRTEDGRYSLGPRLLYWGEAAAETFDLRAIAEPTMRQLRDQVGESVHLYIRDEDTRICIAAVEARHELPSVHPARPAAAASRRRRRQGPAGLRRRGHPAAGARSVPKPTRALAERPGPRPRPPARRVRAERWATSIGERENGVAAVAAPVSDSTGRVVAALCISGPTTRLTSERLEDMRAPVQAAAAEVSGRLRRG